MKLQYSTIISKTIGAYTFKANGKRVVCEMIKNLLCPLDHLYEDIISPKCKIQYKVRRPRKKEVFWKVKRSLHKKHKGQSWGSKKECTGEGKTQSTICLMEGLPFRNGKDDKFIWKSFQCGKKVFYTLGSRPWVSIFLKIVFFSKT